MTLGLGLPLSRGRTKVPPSCSGPNFFLSCVEPKLALSWEETKLPLSVGQRVTFFAGAKKVTKETPFESELAQEELPRLRTGCAESHGQLGFRTLGCAHFNFRLAESSECSRSVEAVSVCLLQKNRSEHLYRIFRLTPRRSWARSDSERCFFGDFLCTGKESYPLAAGQRKLGHSQSCPLAEEMESGAAA